MPTGVFARRPKLAIYKCRHCGKEYKHQKRYHNHLATVCKKVLATKEEPPTDVMGLLLSRIGKLEADTRKLQEANMKKDETIHRLVQDLANMKRSHHYIREKQEKWNTELLAAQKALKAESQKLYRDKFWFELRSNAQKTEKKSETDS